MMITPLLALRPYNAAAFGPLRTVIDSMSSGLILATPFGKSRPPPDPAFPADELSKGTPSTINNAWLFPVIEELPLNTTLEEDPTAPELFVTCTPAILPLKAFTKLLSLASVSASPFTLCAAYPIAFSDFLIPKAVTITPSSSTAEPINFTLTVVEAAFISWDFIPM